MSVTIDELVEGLKVDRPDLEIYHEQTGGGVMAISVTQRTRTETGEDRTIYIGNGNGPMGWSDLVGDEWGTWHDIVIPQWNNPGCKMRDQVALDMHDRIIALLAEQMPASTGRYQIVIVIEELDEDGHPLPDFTDSAVVKIAEDEEEADRYMNALVYAARDLAGLRGSSV